MKRIREAGRITKAALSPFEKGKALAKVLFEKSCIYRLNQRPILLFSTRRSGSTLLMYMIHSQPRVDYVDEPLNMWRLHPHFEKLPHPNSGAFVTLTKDQEDQLRHYMNDLLAGKVRYRHRGNLIDRNRKFLANRLVVKNINATPMVLWFEENFDADIVFLIRHPIPVGLSLMRRGWPPIPHAYLENTTFCEDNLSNETIDYARHIAHHGTRLQTYAMEWCLDNLIPFRLWPDRVSLLLTYEEVVMRSRKISQVICDTLDLPDVEAMERSVERPSRTTSSESKREIESIGPSALALRWSGEVSSQDVEDVQRVLDSFGITAYRASDPYPSPELCHFGALD